MLGRLVILMDLIHQVSLKKTPILLKMYNIFILLLS
jgi:hypothetical protein